MTARTLATLAAVAALAILGACDDGESPDSDSDVGTTSASDADADTATSLDTATGSDTRTTSDVATSTSSDAATTGNDATTAGDAGTDTAEDTVEPPPNDPCPAFPPPAADAVAVTPDMAAQLPQMLADATPGQEFALADGTYALGGETLWIRTPGVTLRGASGNRSAVVIDNDWQGGSILAIQADDVTIADLTVQRAWYHPIHITPRDATIEGVRIYNVAVIDPGQQAIKINTDGGTNYVDHGEVACSYLALTDQGRPEVRDNCYTGGIDAHQAQGWTFRDNLVEGFWCDAGLSEHGIHVWRGCRDTVIERNVLHNNARAIGLGLTSDDVGRRYPDSPCGGAIAQDYDGLVRNNMIFADDPDLFASGLGFDAGIGLESACNATVVHNTVWSTEAPYASIDVRFPLTSGLVANNIVASPIRIRNDGAATVTDNVENATSDWFVDAADGDLHLAPAATAEGNPAHAALAPTDIDGDSRTDGAVDLGADQRP